MMMASIDLNAAFEHQNVDQTLESHGLADNMVSLIEIWLSNRMFYVEINDQVSKIHNINHVTIQGSILGLVLYAI